MKKEEKERRKEKEKKFIKTSEGDIETDKDIVTKEIRSSQSEKSFIASVERYTQHRTRLIVAIHCLRMCIERDSAVNGHRVRK